MKPFTKPFACGLFLGVVLMTTIGAATDDSLKRIADTLGRIARSMEILANQPKH